MLGSNSFSQSRVNKVNLEFDTYSQKIYSATGWKLNETTGSWVSNDNLISSDEPKTAQLFKSHNSNNFNWIQINKVTKDNTEYYILIYECLSGKYKYPHIKQDWEEEVRVYYIILNTSQYTSLKACVFKQSAENLELKIKSNNIYNFMTDAYEILGGEHLYNEANLLSKITKEFEQTNPDCYHSFVINSQLVDGEMVVRFMLPKHGCFIENTSALRSEYFELTKEKFLSLFIDDTENTEFNTHLTNSEYGVNDDTTPLMIVENMPAFGLCKSMRGDERTMCTNLEIIKFVSKNTKYPSITKNAGIQGKVYISFVVGKDGYVKDVTVLREVDSLLNAEAIRVIESLPRFMPGRQRGQFVNVQYTIPVSFYIRE